MTCLQCGGEMVSSREDIEYGDSGIPDVTLLDIVVDRCSECGASELVIPRIEELHRTIAFAVVLHKAKLGGIEVRFLRKYLGYSSKNFAETVGVTPETVSRWEHDKETISVPIDHLIRLMVLRQAPIDAYPTSKLAEVAKEPPRTPKIHARSVNNAWEARAVA